MSIWRIEKCFTFEASHFLPHVPKGHKCGRMHGHSYVVTVILESRDLIDGMVFEYGDLSDVVRPIVDGILDHQTLNEIEGLGNPTTEVLAKWIFDRLRLGLLPLAAISVKESFTTRCEYRP